MFLPARRHGCANAPKVETIRSGWLTLAAASRLRT
jgi:hypothetical protein